VPQGLSGFLEVSRPRRLCQEARLLGTTWSNLISRSG
jgi:hypothetical protein